MLPASVRRADAVAVPSEATRSDVAGLLGVPPAKIHVVPLGIRRSFRPLPPGDESRELVRRQYGLPEHFLLFAGQLEPKKNLPTLLEAFHLLKSLAGVPHKLVITGHEGWRVAEINAKARMLGLGDDVVFTGFVSENDLVTIYNLADVFVFPSVYEGFGLPPLEAMACGTPVVCTNRGAVPEVVGDGATCVDVDRPAVIADAIRGVLADPAARAGLVERGLARARRFTWERAAGMMDELYRQVFRDVRRHGAGGTRA
jgi:glycosyltransferase involved in cell wall biosynthesis